VNNRSFEAVRAMPEPDQEPDRFFSFTGVIDGPSEPLSEQIDAVLYGG